MKLAPGIGILDLGCIFIDIVPTQVSWSWALEVVLLFKTIFSKAYERLPADQINDLVVWPSWVKTLVEILVFVSAEGEQGRRRRQRRFRRRQRCWGGREGLWLRLPAGHGHVVAHRWKEGRAAQEEGRQAQRTRQGGKWLTKVLPSPGLSVLRALGDVALLRIKRCWLQFCALSVAYNETMGVFWQFFTI